MLPITCTNMANEIGIFLVTNFVQTFVEPYDGDDTRTKTFVHESLYK